MSTSFGWHCTIKNGSVDLQDAGYCGPRYNPGDEKARRDVPATFVDYWSRGES
jgi:hypothetical protein